MQTGESFTAAARTPGDRSKPVSSYARIGSRARVERSVARDRSGFSTSLETNGKWAEILVSLLSRGERLGDGRYVLRTSGTIDAKGPREIAIGPGAASRFAKFAGAIGIAAVTIAVAFLVFGFAATVPLGIAIGMVMQHGKGAVARLLDTLGERIEKPDRD